MFACIYSEKIPVDLSLTDFAYAFSPVVEETKAGAVVIDVDGCELLFGSAYQNQTTTRSHQRQSRPHLLWSLQPRAKTRRRSPLGTDRLEFSRCRYKQT